VQNYISVGEINILQGGDFMEYRIPKKGDIYRHFKGNLYEIVIIARDSETLEEKVVYKSVNSEDAYVRNLAMFLSKVDKVKYPDVKQEFRFELVSEEDTKICEIEVQKETEPVMENQKMILEFLELDTTNDKIQYLVQNKDHISDNFLSVAAHSLDFVESAEDMHERLEDILKYLRTVSRYENTRFR